MSGQRWADLAAKPPVSPRGPTTNPPRTPQGSSSKHHLPPPPIHDDGVFGMHMDTGTSPSHHSLNSPASQHAADGDYKLDTLTINGEAADTVAQLPNSHTHDSQIHPLHSSIPNLSTTPIHISSIPNTHATVGYQIGDFQLLKVIGRGAYGKVFQAYKRSTGTIYAIKALKKFELLDRKVSTNVLNEKSVLQSINHPFIVTLCYAFQNTSKLYLVMNYVGGGELFTRLDEVKELNDRDTAFYAAQILLALEHLHNLNILYRDLKPENILIGTDGYVVLTDFGFAKHVVQPTEDSTDDEHRSTSFVGTVQYMAPEIVQKNVELKYNTATDWWALGILIYEMLTGRTPYDSSNRKKMQHAICNAPVKIPRWLSKNAASIIDELLIKEPRQRLGSRGGGAQEIKNHPFFAHIDWDALIRKDVRPPFIPSNKTEHYSDTSRFDKQFTDEKVIDSPADTHHHLLDNTTFAGFSYARDFTPADYQYKGLAPITETLKHTTLNDNDDSESNGKEMSHSRGALGTHHAHDAKQPKHGTFQRYTLQQPVTSANGQATSNSNDWHHPSTTSTTTDGSSTSTQPPDSPTITRTSVASALHPSASSTSIASNRSTEHTPVSTIKKSASSSLSLQLAAIRSSPSQQLLNQQPAQPASPAPSNASTSSSSSKSRPSDSGNAQPTKKLITQLQGMPVQAVPVPINSPTIKSASAWNRPLALTPNKGSSAITIQPNPVNTNRAGPTATSTFSHHRSASKPFAAAVPSDDASDEPDGWETVQKKHHTGNKMNWKYGR